MATVAQVERQLRQEDVPNEVFNDADNQSKHHPYISCLYLGT